MDIISNLNERLTIGEGGVCRGGEDKVKKVLSQSPVELPDDYIELLRIISGDENLGIGFQVDGSGAEIYIWSAELSLQNMNLEFNEPFNQDFLNCSWLIGDNLGGLVYFYGAGKEGYGLYRVSAGGLSYNYAVKIADSLTDFLVKGVGINIAISLTPKE